MMPMVAKKTKIQPDSHLVGQLAFLRKLRAKLQSKSTKSLGRRNLESGTQEQVKRILASLQANSPSHLVPASRVYWRCTICTNQKMSHQWRAVWTWTWRYPIPSHIPQLLTANGLKRRKRVNPQSKGTNPVPLWPIHCQHVSVRFPRPVKH